MVWRATDPCGDEAGKIRWELPQYTRGRGLDVGCGPSKGFPHFIGVDNYTDTQLFGIQMKPDVVSDCTKLEVFGSASMDFVYSSHLLEHVKDPAATLKEWWRLVKPAGFLVLYLPHKEHYPNIGTEGANPDHKSDFMPQDIVDMMKAIGGWDLVRNEDRAEDREYSFFQVYKKRTDGKHLYSHKEPKPVKSVALVRYGAFGDMLQISSVMPALKEQGFHITVYTTPRGQEVLKHDPHIDAFYIQDTDQIPNGNLPDFWANEAKKFDRFVNFSESIEGTLLALPGRANHRWPQNLARKHRDKNYFEFTHDLAQADMPPKPKFYATEEEKAWAKKERAKFGGDMLIMYSLAGSSVHKVWPWQDQLFARILIQYPNARIVTVGDEMSQMLEQGWENEARVICKAGKYSIRESMSLLGECDFVIGSETGILNAAGHMPMAKILFLSHSTENMLSKHWVNTASIEPENTTCYPCMKMHYSFEHCNRDEATGVALCAANTSLDKAWAEFEKRVPTLLDVAIRRNPAILERVKEIAEIE